MATLEEVLNDQLKDSPNKDDNDDVNGYNELLRKLVQNEDKANEK